MKLKHHNNISESQIEDALVANLSYLVKILRLAGDLRIVGRQLWLKDGDKRLDLLLSLKKNLYLVELKITKYSEDFLYQIIEYRDELVRLQDQGELVSGNIISYLLVTEATTKQVAFAKTQGVFVVIYEPLDVLKNYYENLAAVAPFLKIKPNDYGVFSLGLINRVLIKLFEGETEQSKIASLVKLSKGSVHNHLKVAKEFGLVRQRGGHYFLTDIGDKYAVKVNKDLLVDQISQEQIEILKQFISKDPFYSATVFGVYSIVESAFLLSRNSYPVELRDLQKMFQVVSGKTNEWISSKSLSTATYTFLNFSIDLELLGKIGKKVVITPAGFKFILMLQLHKSIEMIESLSA